ncbi:MAG: NADPH-dependent FMN reductase [Bdellovibrionales bacterium]
MARKILTLVGGISKNSLNQKLFQAIRQLPMNDFELTPFDISRLPFFSQDIENDPPESVRKMKDEITSSAGVLLITPEYNRSMPGVLKNALDWGSRPYGTSAWAKKPVGVMGASPGATGTFGAQHHLRQVLSGLNMFAMSSPEMYLKIDGSKAFDDKGRFADEKLQELIRKYFSSFNEWVNRFG